MSLHLTAELVELLRSGATCYPRGSYPCTDLI
jgi:hypothetical protein